MKIYVFGNYMDFKCLAGNCQTTCCSGWKIVVDREAYERFKNLENKSLRADILSNIVEKDDVHSFKNRTNGDCAMLDGDGLCRYREIQMKRHCVIPVVNIRDCRFQIKILCSYLWQRHVLS